LREPPFGRDPAHCIIWRIGFALTTASPQQTHILNALPPAERQRLFPHLKLIELPLGAALYESGDTPLLRLPPQAEGLQWRYVAGERATADRPIHWKNGFISSDISIFPNPVRSL
jgi:hypothetical protein